VIDNRCSFCVHTSVFRSHAQSRSLSFRLPFLVALSVTLHICVASFLMIDATGKREVTSCGSPLSWAEPSRVAAPQEFKRLCEMKTPMVKGPEAHHGTRTTGTTCCAVVVEMQRHADRPWCSDKLAETKRQEKELKDALKADKELKKQQKDEVTQQFAGLRE
jgi:hypothetical protein